MPEEIHALFEDVRNKLTEREDQLEKSGDNNKQLSNAGIAGGCIIVAVGAFGLAFQWVAFAVGAALSLIAIYYRFKVHGNDKKGDL